MQSRKFMPFVSIALLAGLWGGAYAQDWARLASIYDLGRIEVVSDSADKNATIDTISQEQIAATNSYDVASALRFQPGVFYNPPTGQRGEPNIGIRGYGITHIGFFIDGVPVHSIYDRQTDFSHFSAFGLSEISVSKGYTSPVYGANTLGGAINMVTSKPTKELEVQAKYDFISNNENRVAAQVGTNQCAWYAQASYSFSQRDSINLSQSFKSTPYQDGWKEKFHSGYKNHTIRAKVGFAPNEDHEYSLNVIYEKGEKDGQISQTTNTNFWEWPHYDKTTIYALGNSKFSDLVSLNSRIYYDRFYNVLESYGSFRGISSWRGKSLQFMSVYNDYALGLIETLSLNFNENQILKLGVNMREDNHREADSVGGKFSDEYKDLSTSFFAEYSHRLNEILRFAVNGSYDRNDMQNVITDFERDKAISASGFTLQGVVYADVTDFLTLHANVGQKAKIPTLKDRYSTTWGNRTPNPDLQTETALNYELGAAIDVENVKAGVNVFYNDSTNMLISVPDDTNSCLSGTECYKLTNAREGYAYGGEAYANISVLDELLNFGVNYSYITKKITNKNGSSYGVDGSRIQDYPTHIASFNIALKPIKQLDVLSYMTYQSAMWSAFNAGTNRAPNFTRYEQGMDIFLVDLLVRYRPIENVQLQLGAYNLLDKNYYYGWRGNAYYQAGRRVLAGVEIKF